MPTTTAIAGPAELSVAEAAVLVVDDNPVARLALRAALEPLGHPIVEAASGAQALSCVASRSFAVVLMDICMPEMDGYETAARVRGLAGAELTPIIFATAQPRAQTDTLRGYRLGAVDFLFLPVEPEELRGKVGVFASLFTTSRRLRSAGRHFELSGDLACTIGFDGYFRQLNASWTQTLGWSESELRSRPFTEFVHADDRDLSAREAARLAAGAATAGFVNRYLTSDGGWRWLEWNAVAAPEEGLLYASARDVSERHRAAEAITRLASIVELFDDAVIGVARDGTVVSWNPAAERLLGQRAADAVGRPICALMLAPPERSHEVTDNLARIRRGERVPRMETVRMHKDGHPIDVALTISPTKDARGELSGASATLRDITQAKRTQRYLDAQHEATRVLAEAATAEEALPRLLRVIGERMEWPVCAVWMPQDGGPAGGLRCAAFWHERGLELGGFEALSRGLAIEPGQGIVGQAWKSRCPRWVTDVGAEPHSPRAAEAIESGLLSCVVLPILSDGKPVAVIELRSLEARPLDPALLDSFDRLSGQLGLFLERKQGQMALESSERQTRQILDSAHDAFVSIDEAGSVRQWNPSAEATFGWSAEEAIGRQLTDLIIPEALRHEHRDGMRRFMALGEGRVFDKPIELTALRRDGREIPVEWTISALAAPEGYSFNAFLRDITDRKRHEHELASARDEALAASKLKSAFVANVSHEIRTPMNGVIGMTGLLLGTSLDDEQREYAETVSASGEALLGVIDDILDFSRIEADRLELDPADFDLRGALEKACGMLARTAADKGLELVLEFDAQLPPRVHADAGRICQVVANLLSNAVKFTASGEVVVRAELVRRTEGAALVRVEVSDTGIGLEPAELAGLFEPFTQVDGSTTREYGGTGLGLAISRQLVEMMGGAVGCQGEPGEGSLFWFELSLPAARHGEGRTPERGLAGLRALVVDDNATNRLVLLKQLGSFDAVCDCAESASQAMLVLEAAHAAERPYGLALLDAQMPGVDGRELARAIRARPALRDMRLMLLAPSGERPARADADGVDGYLTKPVRHSRLLEEIQAVMAGDDAVAALRSQRRAPLEAERLSRKAPLILVVEDTPVNQTVVVRMLERCGFEADVAENGRLALEALAKERYAAVLMDCQMPEMDGYDATREIRRLEQGGRRTPVIALTASTMRGDRERCLAAGMDDYLSKPLRTPMLLDALDRWVSPAERASEPAGAADEPAPSHAEEHPPLLDRSVIADLRDLDGEVLSELIILYFDGAATQLAELESAVARGEAAELARAAHKLKGSSATLGAARVSQLAGELESRARGGEAGDAEQLVRRLAGAIEESRDAFHQMPA